MKAARHGAVIAALSTGLSAGIALTPGTATAGGVERSTQSVGILFEQGNYAEFSIGRVQTDVSGTQQPITLGASPIVAVPGGAHSGDMSGDYNTYGLSVKTEVTDGLHFALVLDEPVGADVEYAPGSYIYGGSSADINSLASTAYLRYELPQNFSVIGGVRQVRTKGTVALFNGYQMTTDTQTDYGYVLGVAWEKPEIAARVALTYNSAITHDFNTVENGVFRSTMETEIPQSVMLEGQTGIMEDTLLFGSVRWVNWTAFDISPTGYLAGAGNPYNEALVEYEDDTITYTLGVGRRFNDTWSGAAFVSHETGKNGYAGNLGPTDGSTALGLAATYTRGAMKITGGVRYVMIGDAETEVPAGLGIPTGNCSATQRDCGTLSKFRDNDAVAFGLRVGFTF